jgi:hypothetical protein
LWLCMYEVCVCVFVWAKASGAAAKALRSKECWSYGPCRLGFVQNRVFVVLNKMGIIFFFVLLKMIDHLWMGFAGGFLEFGEDFCSIKLKRDLFCFANSLLDTYMFWNGLCLCVVCK